MEAELRASGGGVHREVFLRVDAATGDLTHVGFARMELMRRFHLSVRDLRLLHRSSDYGILVRERAILCNLGEIRCLITADEMLLPTIENRHVLNLAADLQRRQLQRGEGDELPFEFRALELALKTTCSLLDAQATEMETICYPLIDELTSKLTTVDLLRVRRIKSELLSSTRMVQKVRDEIKQRVENDGDMAKMCLTEKKQRVENDGDMAEMCLTEQKRRVENDGDMAEMCLTEQKRRVENDRDMAEMLAVQARPGPSHSAPVSLVLPPSASWTHNNLKNLLGSRDVRGSKEEVEIMLEAYLQSIDDTLNKLTKMKQYIDDTLEFIDFNLDSTRNQLIKFDLLMTSSSFVTSLMGVVLGIFGMNFDDPFFKAPHAFEWTLTITVVCGLVIFCFILLYFMKRMYLPS